MFFFFRTKVRGFWLKDDSFHYFLAYALNEWCVDSETHVFSIESTHSRVHV